MDINLGNISRLASEKLSQEVVFTNIEKIGSGYHSNGYKLTTSEGILYFLKEVKSHDLGFEFPERKVFSLMVSNSMSKRSNINPKSVAVILEDKGIEVVLPEVTQETKIYHLQEFGGQAKSYSSILENNLNKTSIDEEDRRQITIIADNLYKIHQVKHPSMDSEILKAVYNDSLRSLLTHPELSLMLLADFPDSYNIFPLNKQKELLGLMFENIKKWSGRFERMSALHGDFWGANILFREDKNVYFIDFSRIPWGDPGIDVGWFLAEYLWYYHATKNVYFKDLANLWLETYQNISKDMEINKALILPLGFIGIVRITPRFFPDLDEVVAKNFINHILEILKTGKLVWND